MQRIGQYPHPAAQNGLILQGGQVGGELPGGGNRVGGKNQAVSQGTAGIGKKDFFGKTCGKPEGTAAPLALPGLQKQLPLDGFVPDDGTGNALMKQSRVKQNIPVAFLGRGLPTIYIHHIGQQLEGIKGDADGQHDFLNHRRDRTKEAEQEARIFKPTDEGNVDDRRSCHPELPQTRFGGTLCFQGAEPGDQRHKHQKQQIFGAAPSVEDQGKNQQHPVLPPLIPKEDAGQQA